MCNENKSLSMKHFSHFHKHFSQTIVNIFLMFLKYFEIALLSCSRGTNYDNFSQWLSGNIMLMVERKKNKFPPL